MGTVFVSVCQSKALRYSEDCVLVAFLGRGAGFAMLLVLFEAAVVCFGA